MWEERRHWLNLSKLPIEILRQLNGVGPTIITDKKEPSSSETTKSSKSERKRRNRRAMPGFVNRPPV